MSDYNYRNIFASGAVPPGESRTQNTVHNFLRPGTHALRSSAVWWFLRSALYIVFAHFGTSHSRHSESLGVAQFSAAALSRRIVPNRLPFSSPRPEGHHHRTVSCCVCINTCAITLPSFGVFAWVFFVCGRVVLCIVLRGCGVAGVADAN